MERAKSKICVLVASSEWCKCPVRYDDYSTGKDTLLMINDHVLGEKKAEGMAICGTVSVSFR